MRIRSQKDAILNYMEKYGSICHRQAAAELGVDRLAARISEIKEILKDPDQVKAYGWDRFEGRYIETLYDYVRNRYGRKTRIARYRLNALEKRKEA